MTFHEIPHLLRRNARTLLLACLVLLFGTALGGYFFVQGRSIMEEELKERLRTTVAVAAEQFDAEAIRVIRDRSDMETPAFRKIVSQLRRIRESISNIRYAYIMRQTGNPLQPVFVADADSLAGLSELDEDGDGVVSDDEEASYPGDLYDATDAPVLQHEAFEHPSVDEDITIDQGGSWISSYAPIRDARGNVVATLGIDMGAEDFLTLSQRIFSPIALLLVILAGSSLASVVYLHIRRQQIETLQKLDAERTALIALASHELGTPLSIFKWWMEILHEKAEGSDDIREVSTQLEEGIERMEKIVSTLRKARYLMEDKIDYQAVATSLREIIEAVVDEFSVRLQHRHQKIVLSFDHGNENVWIDRELISGVIRELIENAVNYSSEGGTITIRTEHKGKLVEVSVKDTGYGIPAADLPRLFQKLSRGGNAAKYKPKGTGMGLFLAKNVVEKAGGTIALESKEGTGTTVKFTLPLT
jgi:signal transduction histidine kinase